MARSKRKYQLLAIASLIATITAIHYQTNHSDLFHHIFHRELYFIPIAIATLLFGMKIGLITAVTISAIYAPQIFMFDHVQGNLLMVGSQISVFILVALILGLMVERYRKDQFIKASFGETVSKEVRDQILGGDVSLRRGIANATILSADIRNFNKIVETFPPWETVEIINLYFKEMAAAIQDYGGMVLQTHSDKIQAAFGLYSKQAEHQAATINASAAAISASIDMCASLYDLNKTLKQKYEIKLEHDIGIHSGPVLAADIGSPSRSSYGIIGKTVTITEKIRKFNALHGTDILISEAVADEIPDEFPMRKLSTGLPYGSDGPYGLYEIQSQRI